MAKQDLRDRVITSLAGLLGKPLWGCGRAAELLWLQFGERSPARSFQGRTREVGEYALHVQCAWRIVGPQGALSASDLMPATCVDEGLSAFVTQHCPAVVQAIAVDHRGGLSITLAGGCGMEVLPDAGPDEQWRLLQPGRETPHVVLVGNEVSDV